MEQMHFGFNWDEDCDYFEIWEYDQEVDEIKCIFSIDRRIPEERSRALLMAEAILDWIDNG